MKLTNAIKDSIIYAVMKDTPEEYSREQARNDAEIICVQCMPLKVRELWERKETRQWVKVEYANGIEGYIPSGGTSHPEFVAIIARSRASARARDELRKHVRNVVYQFSTDKQMRESIPELDIYIPKVEKKIEQLPIVTGLVDELKKAGFPKGAVL